MANILAVGTGSLPSLDLADTPLIMPVIAVGIVGAVAIGIPALGAVGANEAKKYIVDKLSKLTYSQASGIMINNLLQDMHDIFTETDVKYDEFVKNPSETKDSYQKCLQPNQKKIIDRSNVGPLVTALRQAYTSKKFKKDEDENSPYQITERRNKLIKNILKMIFGDSKEYDAHINRFSIKSDSILAKTAKIATQPFSGIAQASMKLKNSALLSDVNIYASLVDIFNKLLKVTPDCNDSFTKIYKKKPVNQPEDANKPIKVMEYSGKIDNDIAFYTSLNLTEEEIEELKQGNNPENNSTHKKDGIITFENLWQNYETKMDNLKKRKIEKTEYEGYYKEFVKYIKNASKKEFDYRDFQEFFHRLIGMNADKQAYRQNVFNQLYGETIQEKSNLKDLFSFFFPPPNSPDPNIPIFKEENENYTDTGEKIKIDENAIKNWNWKIEGYTYKPCNGETDKYNYNKEQDKCTINPFKQDIDSSYTDFSNKYENPYKTQNRFRTEKKIEFSNKVTKVIAALQNKIGKMKNTSLCNDCSQAFKDIGKMTIDDIRAYLKEKKPCLCKNHITEFMDKIIQEKNKKGGTNKKIRKTRKRKTRKSKLYT